MTEAQWLACDDPEAMLALGAGWPLASARKLRLFACACARLPWHPGLRPEEWRVIEAAERMAEDPAGTLDDPDSVVPHATKAGLAVLIEGSGRHAAEQWSEFASSDAHFTHRHACLLHDIVGNPYRPVELWSPEQVPPVGFVAAAIMGMAIAAYEERLLNGTLDPVRLAVLADALEEVGCDSQDLLRHLRGQQQCPRCRGAGFVTTGSHDWAGPTRPCDDMQGAMPGPLCGNTGWAALPGPHVRGCWALDFLLGKE